MDSESLTDSGRQQDYGATNSKPERPGAHLGNSAELTAAIIVADVVGAGILSAAGVVAQLGWLLGTLVILLMLALNVHTSILMWRAYMLCPGVRTMPELVAAAFAQAPEGHEQLAVQIVSAAQQMSIFLSLGLYMLSFGKGLGMLFFDAHLCLPQWALIGCAILLPFQMAARTMGFWKSLIWANMAAILATITIPLVYMACQGVRASRPVASTVSPVADNLSFFGLLNSINILAYAFTGQTILVEVMSEMKDMAEFPKAYVAYSAPFQAATFLLVGLGGYYYRGSMVAGMIGDNIPFGDWFRVAAGCLMIHMAMTFLVNGVVLCRSFHSLMGGDARADQPAFAWYAWGGAVLFILGCSWLTSQVIPFFSDLVDLLGASLTPFTCWLVPIGLYLRCLRGSGVKWGEMGKLELALIAFEVLLSVVFTIFGTYAALATIWQQWQTYGGPFACHCEGLWDTCACSASHAGMEACPAQPGSFA